MSVLIHIQWRLIRNSLILWTVVGAIFSYSISGGGFSMGQTEQTPMFAVILAASIGARLFAREAMGSQGVYLRSLPVSWNRLFTLKIGMGLAAIAACLLAHVLFWHAGVLQGLHGLFQVDDPIAPPSTVGWQVAVGMCWMAFAASAFFACAFEKILAARQAGVPGFFMGFALANFTYEFLAPRDAIAFFSILLFGGALLLVAAWRLGQHRGVGEVDPHTRTLGRLKGMDRLAVLLACLPAVVLPLSWAIYAKMADIHPYVHIETFFLTAGFWLGFGVLAIPWSLAQARSRTLTRMRAAALFALNLTGVGVFIWRAIRLRGEAILCGRCTRRRMPSIAHCPTCESASVHPQSAWRGLRRFIPTAPWPILGYIFALFFFGTFLLGGQRYIRAYEIQVEHPEVEIFLNGDFLGTGNAKGWKISSRRLGPPFGGSSFGGGSSTTNVEKPIKTPISFQSIINLLREPEERDWEGLPHSEYLQEFFHSNDRFNLRYRGLEASVYKVGIGKNMDDFACHMELKMKIRFLELEQKAEALLAKAEADNLRDADLDEAVEWGDLFFYYLQHQKKSRRKVFSSMKKITKDMNEIGGTLRYATPNTHVRSQTDASEALLDAILRRRFQLDREEPGKRAHAIWEELIAKVESIDDLRSNTKESLHTEYSHLYPYLRALYLIEGQIQPFLLDKIRAGSVYACIVAGMSGKHDYYEPCRERYYKNEGPVEGSIWNKPPVEKEAAAWAMVSIDNERAVEELLRSLDRFLDKAVIEILGYSESKKALHDVRQRIKERDWLQRGWRGVSMIDVEMELLDAFVRLHEGFAPQDYFIWN